VLKKGNKSIGQKMLFKAGFYSVVSATNPSWDQGCQMVSFQTKNQNLGKFRRALDWKMLIYLMEIWNILQTFWDIL
jgi:hypothetical protein